jgi:hypothetical protein
MPVADEVLLARLREVLKTADFEKTTGQHAPYLGATGPFRALLMPDRL